MRRNFIGSNSGLNINIKLIQTGIASEEEIVVMYFNRIVLLFFESRVMEA